ncbi:MAG: DUF1700 domain-containing protein [Lachnospiraceae bacterium]
MNRTEFMQKLEALLLDIPESERAEALNYYNEYFNDAGVENEQEVIDTLGSPEKIAATIKEGMNDGEGKSGEFSENGFHGYYEEPKEEVAARVLSKEERGFKNKNRVSGGMVVLIVILCIFALPILGPLGVGIVSAIFGILCAFAAILFGVMAAGIGLCVGAVAVFIAAILTMVASPLVGILLIGISLVLAGIGILLTILGIWILTKGIPPLVRGIVNLCRKPFAKKEEV